MIRYKYLLPVLFCFCLAGCAPLVLFGAGAAAGVGGYKHYKGKLIVVYQAPFIKTWDATLTALEGMNLQILSKEHDLTVGKINAKRVDKKPVHVYLEYRSSQETEVVIRVGWFGDKDASLAIKEDIRKCLFKE